MKVDDFEEMDTSEATIEPGMTAAGLEANRSSLVTLLGVVDEAPVDKKSGGDEQNLLIDRRLGVASSLFRALRAKHSPTANHCLRVALRCSFFASGLGIKSKSLDALEIAALLHDIGKIGVPDAILSKPDPLTADEAEVMRRQRECGVEILAASCVSRETINIIRLAPVHYGHRERLTVDGVKAELPVGARILNIMDAFDAMTTDHVYRRAMSRERAISELFEHSGSQFDPILVREFAKVSSIAEAEVNHFIANRWAHQLNSDVGDAFWQFQQPLFGDTGGPSAEVLFQKKLLDAMHDGVTFIDSSGRILLWNRGAERLTGISPECVIEKAWTPELLDMRDPEGNPIRESNCPIKDVLAHGIQSLRRVTITNADSTKVSVDIHVIPVIDEKHHRFGATLLIHDASSETNLEERVQNLHEKATRDPLTGIANRSEFEMKHRLLVDVSLANGSPCSIIIADIDRFKMVNDVHGHQAGDEALVSFAHLLHRSCRQGDLVARYGGEEFVMLCAGCDNATAAKRAEEIRSELAQTPQRALHGKCITASFGVTELQLGDTTETMLRRADRALYQAKDSGRDRVVQLGSGIFLTDDDSADNRKSWFNWKKEKGGALVNRSLVANVPLSVLAEKIRGFISDHHADIVTIENDHVVLHIQSQNIASETSGRPTTLVVEIKLSDQRTDDPNDDRRGSSRTVIDVSIGARKTGDRRHGDHRARQVLASLKSYLIAQDYFAE